MSGGQPITLISARLCRPVSASRSNIHCGAAPTYLLRRQLDLAAQHLQVFVVHVRPARAHSIRRSHERPHERRMLEHRLDNDLPTRLEIDPDPHHQLGVTIEHLCAYGVSRRPHYNAFGLRPRRACFCSFRARSSASASVTSTT